MGTLTLPLRRYNNRNIEIETENRDKNSHDNQLSILDLTLVVFKFSNMTSIVNFETLIQFESQSNLQFKS